MNENLLPPQPLYERKELLRLLIAKVLISTLLPERICDLTDVAEIIGTELIGTERPRIELEFLCLVTQFWDENHRVTPLNSIPFEALQKFVELEANLLREE